MLDCDQTLVRPNVPDKRVRYANKGSTESRSVMTSGNTFYCNSIAIIERISSLLYSNVTLFLNAVAILPPVMTRGTAALGFASLGHLTSSWLIYGTYWSLCACVCARARVYVCVCVRGEVNKLSVSSAPLRFGLPPF